MRKIYLVVGGVLVAVGVAGFVRPSLLFGLFAVNTLHNVLHVATGGLTLGAAARGIGTMRRWGRLSGAAYAGLGVLGLLWADLFGLMHLNRGDHLLHFALAAVFLYVGLLAPPKL